MYVGRIVETGADHGALYRAPRHPYTEALLSAVPKADPALRDQAIAPSGEVADPANPPPGCAFHPRCPLRRGALPDRACRRSTESRRGTLERLPSGRGADARRRRLSNDKEGKRHAHSLDRAAGVAGPAPRLRATGGSVAVRPGRQARSPTIITDPAQWPKQFREAPALAELVQGRQAAAGRPAHAAGADGAASRCAASANTAAPGGAAFSARATARTATA